MAVDFGRVGNDDYASRSASGFNHNAAYTALTWFKVDVDPNDYQHFIHIGGTYSYDGNTDFIGTDTDGQLFRFGCAGGASNSFLTTGSHYLTVGQWYWCALVRESSTSLKVYRGTNASDGALIATMTNNVGSRASASLMALGGYNSANINGPIGLPRFWSGSALTLAQLHAEVASYSPVITSNLWTAPAFSGADFTAAMADLSGNARNWTRSGTDSTIISDPVSAGSSHATSGALVGPGSTLSGTAARSRVHGSSGDLTGQGSTVAGTAARTRAHPSTGVLTGPGSTVVGAANRTHAHPSSGALVGAGSVVAGSAARTHVHPSSGALVGQGATVAGSADRQGSVNVHEASGSLVGPGASVVGSAARMRAFGSSGVLVGPGAVVDGTATRVGPAVSHDTSGSLVGAGSIVSGQAQNGISQGGFGFVITDTAPRLWWQRKPKALDEQEAEEKVAKVVRVVERIARQQVEADRPAPVKDKKREVREAIAPLVAEMPGFDWMTVYRTILIELGRRQQEQQAAEQAQMEIARIQAMRRDEDDVLLLLMSI